MKLGAEHCWNGQGQGQECGQGNVPVAFRAAEVSGGLSGDGPEASQRPCQPWEFGVYVNYVW
jgi:hypothetical protein